MPSASNDTSSNISTKTEIHALNVEFDYRKWKANISKASDPKSKPVYRVGFHNTRRPQIEHKRVGDDLTTTTIGTGTLHTFHIDAEYELHGQKRTLKTLKRWKRVYAHLSYVYSDNPKVPMTMTWTSSTGFKTWEFVCVDECQNPVARWSMNIWATKKIGKFEFLGPKAGDEAVHDEIVVTGLTLFWSIALRSTHIGNFIATFFAHPGPLEKPVRTEDEESVTAGKT
ncbi:hypothetical protein N7474_007348 [Penicillium riverlandense]|uniref:uncharacterized protein n=1 Tax=Penicillium riverlandense TaxID=1903569 RepID=UPI002548AFA9|nr:uncharacterized protein N7474_007348 [Penicillium riverlandense]KAJ5815571.1 hypothetical protein N7474_007348 [Penicillium riverlandense]